jgi:hypothetical protein
MLVYLPVMLFTNIAEFLLNIGRIRHIMTVEQFGSLELEEIQTLLSYCTVCKRNATR